jgi:hypothetical protein
MIEFIEIVNSICKHPKMYTPNGTFYEIASFLEGYGSNVEVSEKNYAHSYTNSFREWLAIKFDARQSPLNWVDFRDRFDSDLEALENLSVLHKEYVEINSED